MNPLPTEIWHRALSYPDYRAGISRNQEAFDEVYAGPSCTEADLELLRKLPPLRVLALGEDWCPDVFFTLPTWARIAEALPGWELRVLPRDAHPEVMEHFLWKDGAKRIPVYAFYDQAGRLQVWVVGAERGGRTDVDGPPGRAPLRRSRPRGAEAHGHRIRGELPPRAPADEP